jgi:hypothetical protein
VERGGNCGQRHGQRADLHEQEEAIGATPATQR